MKYEPDSTYLIRFILIILIAILTISVCLFFRLTPEGRDMWNRWFYEFQGIEHEFVINPSKKTNNSFENLNFYTLHMNNMGGYL